MFDRVEMDRLIERVMNLNTSNDGLCKSKTATEGGWKEAKGRMAKAEWRIVDVEQRAIEVEKSL